MRELGDVGLGLAAEYRAAADVVRTGLLRRERLRNTVRTAADNGIRSEYRARLLNSHVGQTDMNAVRADLFSEIRTVIDDARDAVSAANREQLPRLSQNLLVRLVLFAQLYTGHTRLNQGFRHRGERLARLQPAAVAHRI